MKKKKKKNWDPDLAIIEQELLISHLQEVLTFEY